METKVSMVNFVIVFVNGLRGWWIVNGEIFLLFFFLRWW